MFFGIGAYGVAIALSGLGPSWGAVLLGLGGALLASAVLATIIGFVSLRLRALYFSMVTLAVASFALIMATQAREITGGEDGLTFSVPRLLSPGFRLLADPLFGVRVDGRVITYYIVFAVAVVMFLAMLRVVNSPFGRVLQAIRENEFRAQALGYSLLLHRTLAGVIGALAATVAGAMLALVLRYNGPAASMSFEIMVDGILLMTVVGGMGTLYGPMIGAILIVLAQYQLQPALAGVSAQITGWPVLFLPQGSRRPAIVSADRHREQSDDHHRRERCPGRDSRIGHRLVEHGHIHIIFLGLRCKIRGCVGVHGSTPLFTLTAA